LKDQSSLYKNAVKDTIYDFIGSVFTKDDLYFVHFDFKNEKLHKKSQKVLLNPKMNRDSKFTKRIRILNDLKRQNRIRNGFGRKDPDPKLIVSDPQYLF